MLNFIKSKTFKVAGFVIAFTLALALVASAADLGTTTLKVGSKGDAVKALQTIVGVTADGSFGPMTKAAVVAWQSNHGLTADGVVGPKTKAAMGGTASTETLCPNGMTLASNCATAPSTTNTTVGLTGGAGSLVSTTPTVLSQYNNEQIGEGEKDVVVAGWELEADDNSDLRVTSARITLNGTGNTGSTIASKYFTDVSVFVDGTKVATEPIANFSKTATGIYSKSVSLTNAIIKAGTKAKITVAVSAGATIDSTNMTGDAWTVDLENVRYVDGTGAILTDNLTITAVAMNFGTFAATTDLEMKVALTNDSPKSQVVKVDNTNDTDGVQLLKFTVEAKGSDITINDLPVRLTVAGSTDVDLVTNTLKLSVGSSEWAETVSTSTVTVATITFDQIDYVVKAGTKATFTVSADINDIDPSFNEGSTLKADLTSDIVDIIIAEDKNGDAIVDADATGTALGENMAFYVVAPKITLVSTSSKVASAGTSTNDDVGEFSITYHVEAIGGTVVIGDSSSATTATTAPSTAVGADAVYYATLSGGTATVASLSGLVTFTTSGGATAVTNGISLDEGEYADVTLTVSRTNTSTALGAGIWQMFLRGVSWATSDTATQNVYNFNLTDYKTNPVTLN